MGPSKPKPLAAGVCARVPASEVEYLFAPGFITDKDILDFLSDPVKQMSYSIRADGTCSVREANVGQRTTAGLFPDLRAAVRRVLELAAQERRAA